jgi:hypothetical protein
MSNVKGGPKFDPTEPNYGTGAFDGTLKIGPAAMTSPSTLATTMVHETTHCNQAAAQRAKNPAMTDWPSDADSVNYDEAQAYDAELRSAANTGLDSNPGEKKLATTRRNDHYNKLPADKKAKFDSGVYPP